MSDCSDRLIIDTADANGITPTYQDANPASPETISSKVPTTQGNDQNEFYTQETQFIRLYRNRPDRLRSEKGTTYISNDYGSSPNHIYLSTATLNRLHSDIDVDKSLAATQKFTTT